MSTETARPAFPILGLLGLLFVGLKLGEVGVVAGWSWWWVTCPFWGPLAFVAAIMVLFLAACVFVGVIGGLAKYSAKKKRERRRRRESAARRKK